MMDISIHALREEGDQGRWMQEASPHPISIHALREEGDSSFMQCHRPNHRFLSTPSARRATFQSLAVASNRGDFYPRPPRGGRQSRNDHLFLPGTISIHALREEGDVQRRINSSAGGNFYPRPPRGGRPHTAVGWHNAKLFLSTPSARRATGDRGGTGKWLTNFYPRPPRGGRPWSIMSTMSRTHRFLSTPSARRATTRLAMFFVVKIHFYPRPPRGGRQQKRFLSSPQN